MSDLEDGWLQIAATISISPPNVREQKMAMPPNFVHSLDSTHMMLTALHCQRYAYDIRCIEGRQGTFAPLKPAIASLKF